MSERTVQEMALRIEAGGREDVQRLLCVMAIGLCESMLRRSVTVADACGYFFAPAFAAFAEDIRLDERVRRALHKAAEFTGLEALAPYALDAAIGEVRELALGALSHTGEWDKSVHKRWVGEFR
jgi:hypothetical protein